MNLEQVINPIAIRVSQEGIGHKAQSPTDFIPVRNAVAIRVRQPWIGAIDHQLLEVGEAVSVGILLRVRRVVGVKTIRQLNVIRDAIAV